MPVRFIGSFSFPTVFMIPMTAAAPHMSYFIMSRSSPGFSEMPPVSKVTPLPMSTTGLVSLDAPV